ncbi:MAG TPA: DUF389 domain-containing protein [Acidimicrobiia bacterium]|nr:DUF389 domain-containing protein [Acidimicrobiia bacterium]
MDTTDTEGASPPSRGLHEGRPALSPSGSLTRRLFQPRVWHEDERNAVSDELFFEGPEWRPFLKRFGTLIVLSTTIAALGLIANSAAVVIGAMLVAPLMTPILAVAAALVHGQAKRLGVSVAVLLGGTLGAIATGWVISRIAPGTLTASELTPELLARTAPSLLDLGVAIAAGLAGGYVLTHPRAGSSLPGVAIAVALVPPLATVGISLELGATSAAGGALLLFTTNLVAIVLSAMTVMLASGFVPSDTRIMVKGRLRLGFAMALTATVGVAVPLTLHTVDVVRDQGFTRDVIATIREWDPAGRIVQLEADVGDTRASVEVVVASSRAPVPAWRLAELLAHDRDVPVDVAVEYRLEQRDEATAD